MKCSYAAMAEISKRRLETLLREHKGQLGPVLEDLGYSRNGETYGWLRRRAGELGVFVKPKKSIRPPRKAQPSSSLLPSPVSGKVREVKRKKPDNSCRNCSDAKYQDILDRLDEEIRGFEAEIEKRKKAREVILSL